MTGVILEGPHGGFAAAVFKNQKLYRREIRRYRMQCSRRSQAIADDEAVCQTLIELCQHSY